MAVILSLNCGSSSLKFALYDLGSGKEARLSEGAVEGIGLSTGRLWIRDENEQLRFDVKREFNSHGAAATAVSDAAKSLSLPSFSAAGHRVVHGGPAHSAPARVTASLIEELRSLIPFAPLHLPSALEGMQAVAKQFPNVPQVACFDTAFHRRMPAVAQHFPLPERLWKDGIRRYGFHGLSFEYIMSTLSTLGTEKRGRVIIAHLGNGASLAAVRDGEPMDTTMGFTPTGGLVMGTRSGDLDPGVLIHLLQHKGYDALRLDELVNRQAGLLGVSGISSDMKTLLEIRNGEPRAALAIALFTYQLRKYIGAMAAAIGGVDTLVFTGGIGEHSAPVRREVCEGLSFLGVSLDQEKNDASAPIISVPGASCEVRVIPTREDLMIARHTQKLLFAHELKSTLRQRTG